MKKHLLLLAVLFTFSGAIVAQCVPDVSITTPGIYPDTTTNLPHGTAGVFYSTDIQVRVLTDTFAMGFNVVVSNITINSVVGLPSGFTFACTPANCVFPGGGNGCIQLSGTNATPGTYDLLVNVTLNGVVGGFIPVSQPAVIEGYRLVLNPASSAPLAMFSASTLTVCEDGEVTFLDLSSNNPDTWEWDFPGGTPASSTDQNPVVVYNTPGVYDVSLTVSNVDGSNTLTLADHITVNAKPDAKITPTGVVRICRGESVTLTANPGPGYDYEWFKYGNVLVGEINQTITVSTAGNYKVKVTDPVTGCTKRSGIRTVELFGQPSVLVAANGATTFCKDGSVNLVASTGIANSIQWTKGGVDILGATSNVYEAVASGFYRAVVTSPAGCSKTSTGITVTVLPSPNAGITADGPLAFCQGDDVTLSVFNFNPAFTYQWELNLQPIPTQNGADYVASTAGKYTYTVEALNGCTRRSPVRKVEIVCREALAASMLATSLSVFPNPTSGLAALELALSEKSIVNIEVYNITGKKQMQVTDNMMEAGMYTLNIDLSTYPRGIYLVRMTAGDKVVTSKLVVE